MTSKLFVELNELIELRRHASGNTIYSHAARSGSHSSKIRGRGMDFAEVRNYQAGDEIRHMEWKITARTGKPHTKLFSEERERPIIVMADFSPSMFFGTRTAFKSVITARLAALITWKTIKQGDRIGGFLFAKESHLEFIPRGRDTSALPLLKALCEYTKMYSDNNNKNYLATENTFNNALQRVKRVTRPGSILIIISDLYQMSEESLKHLSRLRQHVDILVYHICDPLELHPPGSGSYSVTDGIDDLILNTANDNTYEIYQNYCDERIQFLKNNCHSLKIQYNQVITTEKLPDILSKTFNRGNTHA